MGRPLVFEIKGNSLDDGPGIRSVVFYKGCPLSCVWCHNPEGRSREQEIAYDSSKCLYCDDCVDACKEKALSRKNPAFVDRIKCTLCGDCIDACPAGALEMVGMEMTPDEIVKKVERDIPFFENSGGGVTLSGGEPALFLLHAGEVAKKLKERGVHVLLETCGLFEPHAFDQYLYPHLDAIYFDIKIVDPARHKELCGTDNRRILDNFRSLQQRHAQGGTEVLARVPLIPGLTATPANLQAIAAFLKEAGASRVALLPYHPLWTSKLAKLGGERHPETETEAMDGLLPADAMEECRSYFAGFEIA